MEEGADQLLSRAERLLIEVTSCIKPAAVAKKYPDPHIIRDLLLNAHDFSTPKPDTESDLTQIEWLIRGLPEAYESEPTFDDEAVQAILKEGGDPPTQLTLPSVYAANQRVLGKLSAAKMIRIRLCHLLVFSTRYGVRKEGSYFLVYPPSGCQRPTATATQSIMLPLKEIEENGHILAQLMRRNEKRDSIRNYFVGSVDLEKVVDLELLLSDTIIREWINGAPSGTIRIELHGFINSPNSVVRGEKAEAMRLAHAVVPLGGLLGTASLDAMVHCDLDVDDSSHSLIATRMNNISFGQRVSKQKALGPKLGTLTVRVSMLDEQQALALANKAKHHGHHHAGHLLDHEVGKLMIPVVHKGDRVVASQLTENALGEQFTKVHGALDYIPSEYVPDHNRENIDVSQARTSGENATTRPIYGNGKDASGVFGLAVCAVENLKLPIDHVLLMKEIGANAHPTVLVTYKTSAKYELIYYFVLIYTPVSVLKVIFIFHRERERMNLPVPSLEQAEVHVDAGQAHMYAADITQWVAPILEVWLTWMAHSGEEKLLLGLARYPPGYKIGSLVRLPIVDSARGLTRGCVVAAAVLGQDERKVETSLQCLLNFYSLENGGLRGTGVDAHVRGSIAAASAHDDRNFITAQKRDPERSVGSTSEQDNGEETKTDWSDRVPVPNAGPEHAGSAAPEDMDESIGDICFLLNGPHGTETEPEHQPPVLETATLLRSSVDSFLASETAATIQAAMQPTVTVASSPGLSDLHEHSETGIESKSERTANEVPHAPTPELSKNTQSTTTSLHLLDFSLDGLFDALLPFSTQGSDQDIFGCFVCYSLPAQTQDCNAGPREYTLWWDGECALLNGSHRHKFEIAHLDPVSLGRALDSSGALRFVLLASDTDGNLPANPVKLGEAFLSLAELCDMMVRQSGYQVLSLPLKINEQDKRFQSTHRLSTTAEPTLRLSVSHRVEPALLRKSSELAAATGNAAELEMELDLASTAVPARAGPTDALSRLLGFDITQEDLDDMLYFRSTASPEPWVPFALGDPHSEGATSIVDVMLGAASASSASVQPLVAAVADHVFALRDWGSHADLADSRNTESEGAHCLGDGYAALKQSLLELECINKLYDRSQDQPAIVGATNSAAADESKVHEGFPDQGALSSEGSEKYIIESEVQSADDDHGNEEREDNSTELYRSDFESITIDDAVLQDDDKFSDSEDSGSEDGHSVSSHAHNTEQSAEGQQLPASIAIFPLEPALRNELAVEPPIQDVMDSHEQDDLSAGSVLEAPDNEEWVVVDPLDSESFGEALQVEASLTAPLSGPAPAHPVLLNDRVLSMSDAPQREDHGHQEDELSDDAKSLKSGPSYQDSTERCAYLVRSTGLGDAVLEESEMEEQPDGIPLGDEVTSGSDISSQVELLEHINQTVDVAEAPAMQSAASLQGNLGGDISAMGMEESIEDIKTTHSLREVSLCGSVDGTGRVSLTGYLTAAGHLLVSASFDSTRGLDLSTAGETDVAGHVDPSSSANAGVQRSVPHSNFTAPIDVSVSQQRKDTPNSSILSLSQRVIHSSCEDNYNDASGLYSADISVSHADVSVVSDTQVANITKGEVAEEAEEEGKEDSPNTSKIKNIVDSEISRIFGPDVSLHPARELLALQDKRLAVADHVPHPSQPDISDQLGVQYWWNKIETKQSLPTAATVAAPSTQRAQSEMEALRESLQRVQAALPANVIPHRRHAGQQRRFIDAETDRVSNIMMGVFRKSTL